METIKISVDVNVNFSESTQAFISSLFCTPVAPVKTEAKTPAPVKTEVKTPAPVKTEVKTPAPVKTEAKEPSASKSIEDVRNILAKKVNDHRDVIKQKLTELGAPSVTKLDPSKYDDMYNFLNSL